MSGDHLMDNQNGQTVPVNGNHWDLQDDISEVDPEMCEIIKREKDRQKRGNQKKEKDMRSQKI